MSKLDWPVVELFGPTIQGEGLDQGVPCYFIRLGGCDYKCEWCDTPHAVLPALVRKNSKRMNALEICNALGHLTPGPRWVVISGGNPALHDLGPLVTMLQLHEMLVSVETQGSRWQDWIARCDRVAVSPKPPSSGWQTSLDTTYDFLKQAEPDKTFLKVVVFDHNDYLYAQRVRRMFPGYRMFLSAGNDAGPTVGDPNRVDDRSNLEVISDLTDKGRWLVNRAMVDPIMKDVQVQVQNHVLYWGNERGR
jgi:7-carboxy-7-deazaguanine synthase